MLPSRRACPGLPANVKVIRRKEGRSWQPIICYLAARRNDMAVFCWKTQQVQLLCATVPESRGPLTPNRSLIAENPSGARLLRGDDDRFTVHCHGGFEPASFGQKASIKWLNTVGVEPLAAAHTRKQ